MLYGPRISRPVVGLAIFYGPASFSGAAGRFADLPGAQTANMFANMREIVEAGGGTVENIVKLIAWVRDRRSAGR